MGACYSTSAIFKVEDFDGLRNKLVSIIRDGKETDRYGFVNWCIEERLGTTPIEDVSIETLLRLVFTGFNQNNSDTVEAAICGGYSIGAGFDASYGWDWVMCDVFEDICPYLADGSWLYVEPDDYYYEYECRDHKSVLTKSYEDGELWEEKKTSEGGTKL